MQKSQYLSLHVKHGLNVQLQVLAVVPTNARRHLRHSNLPVKPLQEYNLINAYLFLIQQSVLTSDLTVLRLYLQRNLVLMQTLE